MSRVSPPARVPSIAVAMVLPVAMILASFAVEQQRHPLVAPVAWAAEPGSSGGGAAGPIVECDLCTLEELTKVAVNIFNWLIAVGGAAAVLAVVIAGIQYIVAVFSGDAGSTARAKAHLGYAILGVLFLLTAYVIVRTVYLALSGGQGSPPGLQ